MTKVQYSNNRLKSRINQAEERISDPEDRTLKIISSQEQKDKKNEIMKKEAYGSYKRISRDNVFK